MTAYRDWFSTFPSRTLCVLRDLKQVKNGQLWRKRSVTILLMTACSGFVMPFERLVSSRADDLGDGVPDKARDIRSTLHFSGSFVRSAFVRNATNWQEGHVASIEGDVDSWLDLTRTRSLVEGYSTEYVLRLMRNALAHGSVWTSPSDWEQEIQKLVFVQRCDQKDVSAGFDFLIVPVQEFEYFLNTWLEQIAKQESNVYALPLKAA